MKKKSQRSPCTSPIYCEVKCHLLSHSEKFPTLSHAKNRHFNFCLFSVGFCVVLRRSVTCQKKIAPVNKLPLENKNAYKITS